MLLDLEICMQKQKLTDHFMFIPALALACGIGIGIGALATDMAEENLWIGSRHSVSADQVSSEPGRPTSTVRVTPYEPK